MYKDISFFVMRMAPRGVFYMSSRNVNASSILETKVWNWRCLDKERLKFWTNEQIEDPTIMTGQNVFHGINYQKRIVAIEELFAGDSNF